MTVSFARGCTTTSASHGTGPTATSSTTTVGRPRSRLPATGTSRVSSEAYRPGTANTNCRGRVSRSPTSASAPTFTVTASAVGSSPKHSITDSRSRAWSGSGSIPARSTALMLERTTRPVACGCSTSRSSGRRSSDRLGQTPASGHSDARLRGNHRTKVDPGPMSEARSTRPPCASTIWRTIVSPRPERPCWRASSRSPRQKRWNTRTWFSGAYQDRHQQRKQSSRRRTGRPTP